MEIPIEITTKIPITLISETPHFFIKWSTDNKRYRISASFKYLNSNYKMHINIIRDFTKITKKGINPNSLKYLLSLIKNHEELDLDRAIAFSPKICRYLDKDKQTEIILVTRDYNLDTSSTLVFFSLDYWSIEDYLNSIKLKEI